MKLYESIICINCSEIISLEECRRVGQRCPKCASDIIRPLSSWMGESVLRDGQMVPRSQAYPCSELPLSLKRMAD